MTRLRPCCLLYSARMRVSEAGGSLISEALANCNADGDGVK